MPLMVKSLECNDKLTLNAQPALLSQMVYGPAMSGETQLSAQAMAEGDEAGLVVYGYDYAWLGIKRLNDTQQLIYRTCVDTLNQCQEETLFEDKSLLTIKDNAPSAVDLAVDLKVAIEQQFTCNPAAG